MAWNVIQHKVGNGQQEINVSVTVKELANTWATNSNEWIDIFHKRLEGMKRKNIHSANHFYKGTPINLKSLEVWKLDINGDFKYKMFTINFKDANQD